MKTKPVQNERGAVLVIELIVLALVLTVASIAAFRYFEHKKTVSPAVSPVPHAVTKSPTFLDIKELGLKIRLADDIKDAVYAIVGGTTAAISTQSLIDASSACKPGAVGPLGTVGKTTNPDQGFGMLSPNNETVFKLGDYYVYYRTPQSPCSSDPAVEKLAAKQRQSFVQAFKTIQLSATYEFVIKELGIKITLPEGLSGLKYATTLNLRGSDADGREYSVDVARFSTDSLENADSASHCKADSGPLGTIAKYPFDPTGKLMGTPDLKKVGDFYITYTAPQALCSMNNETSKLQTTQFNLLRQALTSASAMP